MGENQESAFESPLRTVAACPFLVRSRGMAAPGDPAVATTHVASYFVPILILSFELWPRRYSPIRTTGSPLMTEHEIQNGFRVRRARGYHLNFAIFDKLEDRFFTPVTRSRLTLLERVFDHLFGRVYYRKIDLCTFPRKNSVQRS